MKKSVCQIPVMVLNFESEFSFEEDENRPEDEVENEGSGEKADKME